MRKKKKAMPWVSSSHQTFKEVPLNYINACFVYNFETDELTWANRPESHFDTIRGYKLFQANFVGRSVGNMNPSGYIRLAFSCNGVRHHILKHHLVWMLAGNSLDANLVIDHIDQNKSNNKITNLRQITASQNSHNVHRRKNNSTGVAGVKLLKKGGGVENWMYHFIVDGHSYSERGFGTKYAARVAKEEKERSLGLISSIDGPEKSSAYRDPITGLTTEEEFWINSIGSL